MKYVKATFSKPVSAVTQIELPEDEFMKANLINHLQHNMVYEVRKELEKQMMSLSVNDIEFTLQDYA